MIKKFLLVLLLSFVASVSYAEGYLYIENPDPKKYAIRWSGAGPNCSEVKPNGVETKGWIQHPLGKTVVINIVLKDNPHVVICVFQLEAMKRSNLFYTGSCHGDIAENTFWMTVNGHSPYRTWACG